ncbi:MAG: hypothetical protein FWF38_01515 [Spirochaetaceae bacterium]|nr:hypothetical protein [Spirochaetaceae bacterium]
MKVRSPFKIIIFLFLIALIIFLMAFFPRPCQLHAQEESSKPLTFFGEMYTEAAASVLDPLDNDVFEYSGVTSLKLNAIAGDLQNAKIDVSVIFKLLYGESAKKIDSGLLDNRNDYSQTFITENNGVAMVAEVRKLYLSVFTEYMDISLGRMIINYGRGTIFSPIDLFASVDIVDIDFGRIGTDAARIMIPLGPVSGIDIITTLTPTVNEFTTGARGFGNINGWDFGISAFRDAKNIADDWALDFGFDFKGDLLVGVYGEFLLTIPWENGSALTNNTVCSIMGGIDYSISGLWFFDLEYMINTGSTYYRSATFRGDHNLFASVSHKLNDATM